MMDGLATEEVFPPPLALTDRPPVSRQAAPLMCNYNNLLLLLGFHSQSPPQTSLRSPSTDIINNQLHNINNIIMNNVAISPSSVFSKTTVSPFLLLVYWLFQPSIAHFPVTVRQQYFSSVLHIGSGLHIFLFSLYIDASCILYSLEN